ncbi:hypothetical protein L6452_09764 [Arctium lappa]|uniref:Uncharacterized protein n=1 Tax=Arctium lappa TaxID=4217 RepID=A0ACB9DLK7_ARCLA|nr:hypothetical protein L6452_09764 [Arctium lappa]
MGVAGASARQKTYTTKRSHDPSKGGHTPGEGEDKYDYLELMETMGNINMDITNLKKMVKRLVQKKKKKQFVLRRRKPVTNAPKKGESEVDVNMEDANDKGEKYEVEGEFDGVSEDKVQAVETESEFVQAAETASIAAVKEKATVTVNAAESSKATETVGN